MIYFHANNFTSEVMLKLDFHLVCEIKQQQNKLQTIVCSPSLHHHFCTKLPLWLSSKIFLDRIARRRLTLARGLLTTMSLTFQLTLKNEIFLLTLKVSKTFSWRELSTKLLLTFLNDFRSLTNVLVISNSNFSQSFPSTKRRANYFSTAYYLKPTKQTENRI